MTDELLATLVELVDDLRLAFIRVNSERSASLPDPIRVPRPGDPARSETVGWADLGRMMTSGR